VLARHPEQREALRELPFPNLVVPDRAVDSRSLIYLADLVLGAGGTMTREAALMGIPTYSVFAGEQPAVDRELERRGRLRLLRSAGELVPPAPRTCQPRGLGDLRARAQTLVEFFVEHALNGA
jgi:predicted glycosyltransferase